LKIRIFSLKGKEISCKLLNKLGGGALWRLIPLFQEGDNDVLTKQWLTKNGRRRIWKQMA